jgi:hypothetical protein
MNRLVAVDLIHDAERTSVTSGGRCDATPTEVEALLLLLAQVSRRLAWQADRTGWLRLIR